MLCGSCSKFHLLDFPQLWVFMCLLKSPAWTDAKSHWLHLFGFSPLCVYKCLLKLPAFEDAKSHWLHLFGFSPLCFQINMSDMVMTWLISFQYLSNFQQLISLSFSENLCNSTIELSQFKTNINKRSFENAQWRKAKQMQPMRLCILSGKHFEETFEDTQWRKTKQMQPMWLCILKGRPSEETL